MISALSVDALMGWYRKKWLIKVIHAFYKCSDDVIWQKAMILSMPQNGGLKMNLKMCLCRFRWIPFYLVLPEALKGSGPCDPAPL
jgi:hypothetical protein